MIVLLGPNLSEYYNAGAFETDPSTWGYSIDGLTRSSEQKYAGNYSGKRVIQAGESIGILFPYGSLYLAVQRATLSEGKKYLAKARVRVPSAAPTGSAAMILKLFHSNILVANTFESFKTVTEALDAWVEIEIRWVQPNDEIAYISQFISGDPFTENVIEGGIAYTDKFEIYEYEEVDDEDPEEPVDPVEELEFDKVFFSKNPVTFNKAAADGWEELTNVRLYDDVRVEDVADSGDYVSKLITDLPPDAGGNVVFQVREAFRGVFDLTPPTLNAAAERITGRIKLFKHFTGQLQDDEVTPDELTESLAHIVLFGGLSKYAWPLLDFFGNQIPAGAKYLSTNKIFLTWAPKEKQVDGNQEDYLSFFVYDNEVTQIKQKIVATYDDATSETATTDVITSANLYGTLWQFPAGTSNSGVKLINPAKNVVKYTIELLDQDDESISEVRTYMVDPISHPRKKFFLVLNSLGGYEVHRFNGVSEYDSQITKEQIIKFLPYNYSSLDGEKETNSATLQRSTNHSTGYLGGKYSAEWLKYMDDLLISQRVFDVTDGQRRPVQLSGGSFQKGADQNYERFLRFTSVDSYEDESYTPDL